MANEQDFKNALAVVLRWEGSDFTNDPDDFGGATRYGVIQIRYNEYRDSKKLARKSVELISMAEVEDIYRSMYWQPAGCPSMPSKVAMAVFNFQVNSGRGVLVLQQVLGCKSQDGIWGAKTANDLKYYLTKHSETELIKAYFSTTEAMYRAFATVGNQGKFLQGWLNRNNDILSSLTGVSGLA